MKAADLDKFRGLLRELVASIDKDRRLPEPNLELSTPSSAASAEAASAETPEVRRKRLRKRKREYELRLANERRRVGGGHRLFDVGLLEDVWSDPMTFSVRTAPPNGALRNLPSRLRRPASVSVYTLGRIAQALEEGPLAAALEEASRPELMQLNKGASWVRYSVMHLERVLVRQFGAAALGELAPAPNQLIAALIEAAFPHAGWNVPPLGVRQVSEARAGLGKSAPRASGAAASRKAAER